MADRKNGRKLFDRPKPTVGCSAKKKKKKKKKNKKKEEEEEEKKKKKKKKKKEEEGTHYMHMRSAKRSNLLNIQHTEHIFRIKFIDQSRCT